MSFTSALYDWLGRRLSRSEVRQALATETAAAQVAWMELARLIGVSYVSAAVQACEIKFYGEDGTRTLDDAAWLWNVSPNPDQAAGELIDGIVGQMYSRGEAIVLPWRDRGHTTLRLASDWSREPDRAVGAPDHFVSVNVDGRPCGRDFYAGQVYRFNLDATPERRFTAMQQAVQGAYDKLAESAATAYLQGNVKRYKWKRTTNPAGTPEQVEQQKQAMNDAIKKFVTASGNSAVWPEYQGNELTNFDAGSATANASSDFVNIRKDMFELMAELMRMPVSMLTGNVNNFDSVFQSFITFSIDPIAHVIGQELTRKTYDAEQWAKGCRVELDTSHVKHEDLYDAADRIDKLIQDGVLSTNDVLRDFGRDPIDEAWADEHHFTKNVASATEQGGEMNEQGK